MAYVYCTIIVGVIAFQIALIRGAPWGRITQGGRVEGALPRSGRIIAGVSILLLIAMALSILSASSAWPGWPIWTGWTTVATNAVMMVLNWITPSLPERRLWGPITTMIFALALAVVWLGY